MKQQPFKRRAAWALGVLCAAAAMPTARGEVQPLQLVQMDDVESIYEPEAPIREEDRFNAGGVNFDLTVSYLTDYVFRGVDMSEQAGNEDAPNLQFDGYFVMDLGKAPHPMAGVFVNVFEDDPISEFQEIRPYVGFQWNIRPFTFVGGFQSFIYPDRDDFNTNEVYLSATLDDSAVWRTDKPVLSPYVYCAYDFDLYNGVYLEAGVKHEFELEGTGVTITAVADAAYVTGDAFFAEPGLADLRTSGFQHYDLGLIGSYSLNTLLNLPKRYGVWSLNGYLYYTDGIESGLRADTQVWGGVGIQFRY